MCKETEVSPEKQAIWEPYLYAVLYNLYQSLRSRLNFVIWLQKAWTIDNIDSPLLAEFHAKVISSSHRDLQSSKKTQLLVNTLQFFQQYRTVILISGNEKRLDEIHKIKESNALKVFHHRALPNEDLSSSAVIISKSCSYIDLNKEHFNICIDLWYYKVLWLEPKIKEEITISLSPYNHRWKPGISR